MQHESEDQAAYDAGVREVATHLGLAVMDCHTFEQQLTQLNVLMRDESKGSLRDNAWDVHDEEARKPAGRLLKSLKKRGLELDYSLMDTANDSRIYLVHGIHWDLDTELKSPAGRARWHEAIAKHKQEVRAASASMLPTLKLKLAAAESDDPDTQAAIERQLED